jgi:hypothetical protein
VANKALEASGRDESKLPKKIKEWLKTKQRRDEAKRKAAAAKREREERKALAVLIAEGKVAEVPPCRPESQANSQTADDGSEYSTDSMDDEEIRNMRAINARPPPPGPQDPLESLWSKPSSYSLEERQDRNKVLTKVASTPGNPWGDNSPDTPSLENPTLQDGSKNGDSTIHVSNISSTV